MNNKLPRQQTLPFSARPAGPKGHEILDRDGRIVAFARDGYWALLLLAYLDLAESELDCR